MSYSAPEPPRAAAPQPADAPWLAAPKRKRRVWPFAVLALALLLLCGGTLSAIGNSMRTSAEELGVTVTPEPIAPPVGTPGKKTKQQSRIGGDDVVHVGEDAPAGTYRTAVPVQEGDFCSWIKSRDAEAQKVIDVGLPPGGRPQVTLKAGQWFTSRGCPDWVRQ